MFGGIFLFGDGMYMDLFGVGRYFVDLSADDLQLLPDGRKGFFVHIEMKEHMIHIFADGVDLVDRFDEFLEIRAVAAFLKRARSLFTRSITSLAVAIFPLKKEYGAVR